MASGSGSSHSMVSRPGNWNVVTSQAVPAPATAVTAATPKSSSIVCTDATGST